MYGRYKQIQLQIKTIKVHQRRNLLSSLSASPPNERLGSYKQNTGGAVVQKQTKHESIYSTYMCSEHQKPLCNNMTMQAQLSKDQEKPAPNISATPSDHLCHLLQNKNTLCESHKGYEAIKISPAKDPVTHQKE